MVSQLTPSQIKEKHLVSDAGLPVETRKTYYWPRTPEAAHWKTIVGNLWRDLRDKYVPPPHARELEEHQYVSAVGLENVP